MVNTSAACLRAVHLTNSLSRLTIKRQPCLSPLAISPYSQRATVSTRSRNCTSKLRPALRPIQLKTCTPQSCRNGQSLALAGSSVRSQFRRHSSTAASSAPSALSQSPPNVNESFTWDRYLQLRMSRRRYNTAASAFTAVCTTFVGAGFIANQDPEAFGISAFAMDPIVVMGMATLACGATGWLLGPFIGSGVWGMVYRRWKPLMDGKEKDFYRRIKKHRAHPSGQSMNNPVPDYYGEKISSVKDYRRWLKDQRAFRKKRDG